MSWIAIHIRTDASIIDQLSDLLVQYGALSISIEDALAGTDAEEPIFGEPGEAIETRWKTNKLTALFDVSLDGDILMQAIKNHIGSTSLNYTLEYIADTDWVRATQSQFDPISISQRLWITPSWHQAPQDKQAINLILDPGLAFGTGSHPTTRLCLQWLDRHNIGDKTLLDYGCGSGILTIAAIKLGAKKAEGIDIDPQAIIASQQNAAQNDVATCFYLPEAAPQKQYDVVIANILTNPLKTMAPMLAARCRPKGEIVLSGILAAQANDILCIYQEWFDIAVSDTAEGWVLIHGYRRTSSSL